MSMIEVKMSVLEIEKQIAALSPPEVEEVAEWLAAFRQPEYPSQEQENIPGYVGSPAYKEAIKALDEGFMDFEEGRYSTLAEWDKRFRARHNIPDNVEPFTPEELEAFEREMDALP